MPWSHIALFLLGLVFGWPMREVCEGIRDTAYTFWRERANSRRMAWLDLMLRRHGRIAIESRRDGVTLWDPSDGVLPDGWCHASQGESLADAIDKADR